MKSTAQPINLKVLHLLSNYRWTERSEPAVDLAVAQAQLGSRVIFGCGRSPVENRRDVAFYAHLKGLDAVKVLKMPKHLKLGAAWRDRTELTRLLTDFEPQIIHCHLSNAHLLAAFSRKKAPASLIVRSCYNPRGPSGGLKAALLYRYRTDGLVVISPSARDRAVQRYGLAAEAVQVAAPGVELERFSPQRKIHADRQSFGLAPESFVVGVVSRIRASRRIDVVLDAVRILAPQFPHLQLLLAGRGRPGARQTVVDKPARKMGIEDRIVLAGYCRQDRLVAAYRAMDVLVYPVPGTDKSCRTVREAMAAGTPVIASRMGFLPELIQDDVNGRLIKLSAPGLAQALRTLIEHPDALTRLARGALETAGRNFSRLQQAHIVLSFYHRLLEARG